MPMGSALPDWLTPVAWTYLALCLASAAVIAADTWLRGRRHASLASELVWVSSALYLGPFAVVAHARWRRDAAEHATSPAVATLPGGGASAVAHLVAVPLVVAAGWTIAGMAMWPMMIVIFVLATLVLAVYERTVGSRRPARGRGLTLGGALLVGAATVAAFDVGMVGWMVVLHLNDLMPDVTEATFWFLMQVGVVAGLATGYPVVRWLLRRDTAVVPA